MVGGGITPGEEVMTGEIRLMSEVHDDCSAAFPTSPSFDDCRERDKSES